MTTATVEAGTEIETSLLRQPKAVWAVAFACVVAFMGIGLVDPILPAIAKDLDASPSQVELLFTSYFAVTGVAMLITGVVSAGAFLGVVNTVLTETVMKVSPVERPIASAAYSFVRFTGGAIAPWLAGKLAEEVSIEAPFLVGAACVAVAGCVLVAGRRRLAAAEAPEAVSPATLNDRVVVQTS